MKCRSCSADIDAKAIVCYRCGAPTAIPVTGKPEATTPSSAGWRLAAIAVVVVLAVAAYIYFRPH